jgi:hypothetical protein
VTSSLFLQLYFTDRLISLLTDLVTCGLLQTQGAYKLASSGHLEYAYSARVILSANNAPSHTGALVALHP